MKLLFLKLCLISLKFEVVQFFMTHTLSYKFYSSEIIQNFISQKGRIFLIQQNFAFGLKNSRRIISFWLFLKKSRYPLTSKNMVWKWFFLPSISNLRSDTASFRGIVCPCRPKGRKTADSQSSATPWSEPESPRSNIHYKNLHENLANRQNFFDLQLWQLVILLPFDLQRPKVPIWKI